MAKCRYCPNTATKLAAQSLDSGKTRDYVRICDDHAKGWNDDGDWKAPIYPINWKRALDIIRKGR